MENANYANIRAIYILYYTVSLSLCVCHGFIWAKVDLQMYVHSIKLQNTDAGVDNMRWTREAYRTTLQVEREREKGMRRSKKKTKNIETKYSRTTLHAAHTHTHAPFLKGEQTACGRHRKDVTSCHSNYFFASFPLGILIRVRVCMCLCVCVTIKGPLHIILKGGRDANI